MKEDSKNTTMRNANIRITKTNIVTKDYPELGLKAGDTYEVTFEDIVNELNKWCETKRFEYFAIEHYENPENIHYHVVLVFDTNSQAKFSQIKDHFPFGDIKRCKYGVANCVKYLVHMMNPEKYQYEFDDVVTNSPSKLEKYKVLGSTNERKLLNVLCERIIAGDIKEYQIEKIPSDIYTKHKRRIENAFDYRRRILLKNTNRNVTVLYIQGPTAVGKSTFCKAYAKKNNKSIKFSSSGRHPIEGYANEDILVIDDVNLDDIPITEMLNTIDPNNNYEISVRYKRILFTGDMIIICSNKHIGAWYRNEDDRLQDAFYRRIKYVFDFYEKDENNITHYSINKIDVKTRKTVNEERAVLYEKIKEEDPFLTDWEYDSAVNQMHSRVSLVKVEERTFDLKPYININKDNSDNFLETLDFV